jgi:hypothetical protein
MPRRLYLFGGAACLIAGGFFLTGHLLHPADPLLAAAQEIRPGMSAAEAEAVLAPTGAGRHTAGSIHSGNVLAFHVHRWASPTGDVTVCYDLDWAVCSIDYVRRSDDRCLYSARQDDARMSRRPGGRLSAGRLLEGRPSEGDSGADSDLLSILDRLRTNVGW